jgi:hypothetical protein
LIRQHPATLRSNDAARHADQLVDRDGAVLVFGHVDADHLLLVPEQELRHRLRQLGLANAGRPEEQQHTIGTIEPVLERPFVQDQPLGDRFDRLSLTDDPRGEASLDVAEPIGDFAEHHVLGDLRHLRDDVDDIVCGHFPAARDFRLDRRRVEPADHLVRQLEMTHIARGHLERGFDGRIRDSNRVIAFEARPQVVEDVPRLVD